MNVLCVPIVRTVVDDIEASAVIYLPQEEVYDLLFDFTRYPRYSEHLTDVNIRGDGPGARFGITFQWWRLTYTARGRVVDVDPPERIDWKITRDIDAQGYWSVESVPDLVPAGREAATRARLRIEFDRSTANAGALRLPPLVSLDWVFDRLKPVVRREGEKIAQRIVADVEGHPRPVDLEIHSRPDSV